MKKLMVFQNIHMISTNRLYCNRSLWFCVSSYCETTGIKTFQDTGEGSYKNYNNKKNDTTPPLSFSPLSVFALGCAGVSGELRHCTTRQAAW